MNEIREEDSEFDYCANENQNHFSSGRVGSGYNALRQKQKKDNTADFVIRPQGNGKNPDVGHSALNNAVPAEYHEDPDLYWAIQASLNEKVQ